METPSIAPVDGTTATGAEGNTNSTGNCALLELPAELRNRIYEYALGSSEPSGIDRARQNFFRGNTGRMIRFPPLIQTCQQIRGEAAGIWYSSTTFVWFYPSSLGNFACLVGSTNFKAVNMFLNDYLWRSKDSAENSNFKAARVLHMNGMDVRDGVVSSSYLTGSGPLVVTSRASQRALTSNSRRDILRVG